jgi:hypothetical protein
MGRRNFGWVGLSYGTTINCFQLDFRGLMFVFKRSSPCRYISISDISSTVPDSPTLPSSQLSIYYPRRRSTSRPNLPSQKPPPSGPLPFLPVLHETSSTRVCDIEELIWKYWPSELEIKLDHGNALFWANYRFHREKAKKENDPNYVSQTIVLHGNANLKFLEDETM